MSDVSGESTPVARFKRTFERLTAESDMQLRALYAPNVEFEDPFHRIVGRDALTAYFARLNARVELAEFAFGDEVLAAGSAAVAWTMTIRTRRPRQVISVPGVSLLRFDTLITSQRDYFDVGAMMYERVPVLGRLLRLLKRALT